MPLVSYLMFKAVSLRISCCQARNLHPRKAIFSLRVTSLCLITQFTLVSHQPATLPCLPSLVLPCHLPQILPLLRRLLREPEAQELTVQLASSLSERAVTRTIRAIFNVKQPIYDGAASPPAPASAAPVPSRR